MCAWIWFSEIRYSQLKIKHLNDTPSTKAVGDGLLLRQLEVGSQWCVNKDVKVPLQEAELVGTSSSNIYYLANHRPCSRSQFRG